MAACLLQPSKCMWRGGEGTAAWRCVLARFSPSSACGPEAGGRHPESERSGWW